VQKADPATLGCMQLLGSEALMLADDVEDDLVMIKLVRIRPRLVIAERPGDRAKGKPHRFTAYLTEQIEVGRPFKLDPDAALFVLDETGFYRPPDWDLTLLQNPSLWFNATLTALYVALAPVLPAVDT